MKNHVWNFFRLYWKRFVFRTEPNPFSIEQNQVEVPDIGKCWLQESTVTKVCTLRYSIKSFDYESFFNYSRGFISIRIYFIGILMKVLKIITVFVKYKFGENLQSEGFLSITVIATSLTRSSYPTLEFKEVIFIRVKP